MKFCEKCGSYMQRTVGGLSCPRCGNEVANPTVEIRRIERHDSASVDVLHESEVGHLKVSEKCPQCGNSEAFRRISFVSGEHAGIRQERSVEHLRCPKCGHSWVKD